MNRLKSICVFCGSRSGSNPLYEEQTYALGKQLADNNIRLIYGGGHLGLMGALANGTLDNGGKVTGIIPEFLYKISGIAEFSEKLDTLIITDNMHERKMHMFENADAFVALPGGIGTLEELVEQLTWEQLGQHKKPIVLADFDNFWQPFIDLISHMKAHSFIYRKPDINPLRAKSADEIIPMLTEAIQKIDPQNDDLISTLN